jgi:lipoprotein-anchoring transpeptidase ErfK/SrfK
VRIMRGDNSQKDLPLAGPLKVYPSSGTVPGTMRAVSKERFANPTRARVEQKDGKLDWEPPQVGTDPRSGALGEYVVFTDGPLVLHGPPPKKKLHEAYPHACAGLTAAAAKRLYDSSFIGTRIIYRKAKKAAAAPAAKK